jgi:lysophospholipase L1-like esterase
MGPSGAEPSSMSPETVAPETVSPEALPTALAPTPPPGGTAGSLTGSAGTGGASNPPPGTPAAPPVGPITIFIAGDSTVQTYADTASDRDQAGWGQMLAPHLLGGDTAIDNRAIGGRTARRFIDEGRLDEILPELSPGDYLLVQFGTNDGNRTATYALGDQMIPYFLDPATDFKSYLQQYLDGARAHGAIPVLVTPPPRNSAYCTGGNGTGAHAQAMRELGSAQGVSVVDLNTASVNYLKAICPAPTPENFFLLRADGTVDGTHFQENGARILAGFVASGLRAAEPGLSTRIE